MIGRMRKRVKIMKLVAVPTGANNESVSGFVKAYDRWAEIEPAKADTAEYAGQQQSEITHLIRCRYIPDILPTWQVQYGTRVFHLLGFVDPDERQWWTLCYCKEVYATPG